jgi:hypothetical protein
VSFGAAGILAGGTALLASTDHKKNSFVSTFGT